MEPIGSPFVIQNTSDGWQVTWESPVATVIESSGQVTERVSFTVMLPRRANLSIAEVQTYALKRAVELLQGAIQSAAQ